MAKKRRKPILGFVYIFIGCGLLFVLLNSAMSTLAKQDEIAELEKQVSDVNAEKEKLENEIELLSDDDYVTRYARENYIFTKDGEQVAILPEVSDE